jgi:hypothetical protein
MKIREKKIREVTFHATVTRTFPLIRGEKNNILKKPIDALLYFVL